MDEFEQQPFSDVEFVENPVGVGVRIAENELRSWAINAGAPRTNEL